MRVSLSVLAAAVLVLALAACGSGGRTSGVLGASTSMTAGGRTPTTTVSARASSSGLLCSGGTKVRMKVLKGMNGATILLVPVTIDGKGPYTFALDTGSAKSTIDLQLAHRLGLEQVGTADHVQGVAGSTRATIVKVSSWRLGSVNLQAGRLTSLNLFGGRSGPSGLLGSDVLSRFSQVCIDYRTATLRLGTPNGR